jgi:hypothetical protein
LDSILPDSDGNLNPAHNFKNSQLLSFQHTNRLNHALEPLHSVFETSHIFDERWYTLFARLFIQTTLNLLISHQIQVISSQQHDSVHYSITPPVNTHQDVFSDGKKNLNEPSHLTTTPHPSHTQQSSLTHLNHPTHSSIIGIPNSNSSNFTQVKVLLEVLVNIAVITWLYLETIRSSKINPSYKDYVRGYTLYTKVSNDYLLRMLKLGKISLSTFQPNSYYDHIYENISAQLVNYNNITQQPKIESTISLDPQNQSNSVINAIEFNSITNSNKNSQFNQPYYDDPQYSSKHSKITQPLYKTKPTHNLPSQHTITKTNTAGKKKKQQELIESKNVSNKLTTAISSHLHDLSQYYREQQLESTIPQPLLPRTPYFTPPLAITNQFHTFPLPPTNSQSPSPLPHTRHVHELKQLSATFQYPAVLFPCTSALVHIAAHYANLLSFPITPINHVHSQHLFDININNDLTDFVSTKLPNETTGQIGGDPTTNSAMWSVPNIPSPSRQDHIINQSSNIFSDIDGQKQQSLSLGLLLRTWQRHLVKSAPSLIFPPLPIPILTSFLAISQPLLEKTLITYNIVNSYNSFAKSHHRLKKMNKNGGVQNAQQRQGFYRTNTQAYTRIEKIISSVNIGLEREYFRLRGKVSFFLNHLQLSSDITCLISPHYTLFLQDWYRERIKELQLETNIDRKKKLLLRELEIKFESLNLHNTLHSSIINKDNEVLARDISMMVHFCPCLSDDSSDSDEDNEDNDEEEILKKGPKEQPVTITDHNIPTMDKSTKLPVNHVHIPQDSDITSPSVINMVMDHDNAPNLPLKPIPIRIITPPQEAELLNKKGNEHVGDNDSVEKETENELDISIVPNVVVQNYISVKNFVDFSPKLLNESQLTNPLNKNQSPRYDFNNDQVQLSTLIKIDSPPHNMGPFLPQSLSFAQLSLTKPLTVSDLVQKSFFSGVVDIFKNIVQNDKINTSDNTSDNTSSLGLKSPPQPTTVRKNEPIPSEFIPPQRLHVYISLLPTTNPDISALHMCFESHNLTDESLCCLSGNYSHLGEDHHKKHPNINHYQCSPCLFPCVTVYQYQYNQHSFNIQYMIIHVLLTFSKTIYKNNPSFLKLFNPYLFFQLATRDKHQDGQFPPLQIPLSFSFSVSPPHLETATKPSPPTTTAIPIIQIIQTIPTAPTTPKSPTTPTIPTNLKAPLPPQKLLSLLTLHVFQYCHSVRLYLRLMSLSYTSPELHLRCEEKIKKKLNNSNTDSSLALTRNTNSSSSLQTKSTPSSPQPHTKIPFSFPFSLSASPCLLIIHINHLPSQTTQPSDNNDKHPSNSDTISFLEPLNTPQDELDCLLQHSLFYAILYPQLNLPTTLHERYCELDNNSLQQYIDAGLDQFSKPFLSISSPTTSSFHQSTQIEQVNPLLYPFDHIVSQSPPISSRSSKQYTDIPIMTFKSQYPRKISSQFFTTDHNSLVEYSQLGANGKNKEFDHQLFLQCSSIPLPPPTLNAQPSEGMVSTHCIAKDGPARL